MLEDININSIKEKATELYDDYKEIAAFFAVVIGIIGGVVGCSVHVRNESEIKFEAGHKIERLIENKNPDIDATINTLDYDKNLLNPGYMTAVEMKSSIGENSLIGEFTSVNKKEGTIEKGYFIYSLQEDEKGKKTSEPDKVIFMTDVMKAGISVIR